MSLLRKLNTSLEIIKNEGVTAFIAALGRQLNISHNYNNPDETKMIFDVISKNNKAGIMIDVGAHFGSSLAPFANLGWQVFAFEPDPENRERLILKFGNKTNVVIDPRAVSNQQKTGVTFYKSEVSSGISGLSAFHQSHKVSTSVDVTTLEHYFNEYEITYVDFLKIDTEGYDLFVLQGINWNKVTPKVIMCEFENVKSLPLDYNFHDLAQFLIDRGYRVLVSEWYPIIKYGGSHKWRRFVSYPCELLHESAWGNMIAVNDDSYFKSLVMHSKSASVVPKKPI